MAEPRNRARATSGGSMKDTANGWFGMSTKPVGDAAAIAHGRSRKADQESDRGTVRSRETSEGRNEQMGEGSMTTGTGRTAPARKVRTIPPFASGDPPSPPTSPRFGPTTGTTGTSNNHTSRPSTSITINPRSPTDPLDSSFPPLNPVRSNHTVYSSSYDDGDSEDAQAQWWTFARPGKHQAFRGLQAAWNGTMQANKELREESEHYGRDYFSPKIESGGTLPGAGGKTPLPLGLFMGPRLSGDGDMAGTPGSSGGAPGGSGGALRTARFKAMSLPGSRRQSTDGSPRMSRAMESFFGKSRRSPVTEEPMEMTNPDMTNPDIPKYSGSLAPEPEVPRTPPPKRPASVHGDSHHAKPTPKASRKPFHITLPEPTFGNEPLVVVPSHIYRAQAPPTPIGWDRPWQAGLKSYRGKQAQTSMGMQSIPDSPWTRAANADVPWGMSEEDLDGQPIEQRDSTSTAVGTDSTNKTKGRVKRAGWWGRGKKDLIARRKVTVVEKPKTRAQRIRQFWIFDAKAAIGVKVFGMMCLACALGISISVRGMDHATGTDGIIGSSPILTIIYAPPTIIHSLITTYREAFGRPIGLWGMRSKMIWVCFDLFFICVWASDLSLAISDFLTTPLLCSHASPWWTTVASQTIALSPLAELYQDRICARQAGLISFVLLVTMVYVANMVLSLFRILERLATLHKAYEMRRDQEHTASYVRS